MGHAPALHYTPAFALQLRTNHGKTSVRVAGKCLAKLIQCWVQFVWSTWLACCSSSPLACGPGDSVHTQRGANCDINVGDFKEMSVPRDGSVWNQNIPYRRPR